MNTILNQPICLFLAITICSACSSSRDGGTTEAITGSNESSCTDTFPLRDGMGVDANDQPCELDFVVFTSAANPPPISLNQIESLPDSEPLLDALTDEQTKLSYANGATIHRLQEDESSVETFRYTDSQGMTADVQIDDNNLLDRVLFSDGAVVDYQWLDSELTGVTLTDNSGAMFFFDFVDDRFYQTNSQDTAISEENLLRELLPRRLSPQQNCSFVSANCYGLRFFSAGLAGFCHFGAIAAPACYTVSLGVQVAGIICELLKPMVCGEFNGLEPGSGNWQTITRDGFVITTNPLLACEIQHQDFGDPSPFGGYVEGSEWWIKECVWETCGGLKRPDCTLFAPTNVHFRCTDSVNFERQFPGTCVPR